MTSIITKAPLILALAILACSLNPSRTFGEETSPLADAIESREFTTAESLIERKVGIHAAQPDGTTPLLWAVYHDQTSLVESLLEAGADATRSNQYGMTALSLACRNGNGDVVRALLEAGAHPNKRLHTKETPLMIAARTGVLDPVKALLEQDVELDATERNGQTALMWAAAEGHVDVVDALLKAGADYKSQLKSGFTPLFFAIREGQTDVVLRLLEEDLEINAAMQPERYVEDGPEKGTTPLLLAIENGHFELASKLLDAGADPNTTKPKHAPLHAITWVRKPLRGDGDPSPEGSRKMSSLDLVRDLVAHGADVNIRHRKSGPRYARLDYTDVTPFLLASKTSDLPLMKLLIELGADPKLKNRANCTPLLAAAGVGVIGGGSEAAGTDEESVSAIKYLISLGADVNATDNNGNSAMHGAAYKSRPKLIHFLAEQGADPKIWNQKSKFGVTPIAIAEGHRPGNFRPSPETEAALLEALSKADE